MYPLGSLVLLSLVFVVFLPLGGSFLLFAWTNKCGTYPMLCVISSRMVTRAANISRLAPLVLTSHPRRIQSRQQN